MWMTLEKHKVEVNRAHRTAKNVPRRLSLNINSALHDEAIALHQFGSPCNPSTVIHFAASVVRDES